MDIQKSIPSNDETLNDPTNDESFNEDYGTAIVHHDVPIISLKVTPKINGNHRGCYIS